MTAPSHRSFDTAVPLEAPQDLVGFEASHLAAIAVRRRLPFALVLSFVFVALLIAASIAPSLFTHFDPLVGDFSEGLKPPGWAHLFGTDRLGRDVFARTVFGTRYSLLIGSGGVAVGLGAGIVLGIIAGQRNRILDEAVSRLFDMLSSFPGVLLAMLIVTFLGQGMLNIAIAVGIAGIPKFGRVVRAQTQLIRDADYVTHAAEDFLSDYSRISRLREGRRTASLSQIAWRTTASLPPQFAKPCSNGRWFSMIRR
ncbi:ABC transporter permease [Bradyrhizobium barranii subsp. barranii]|uniref:ABC transporter permease n=1 Tax=Bradyrhizobium barranii subsp. barranii TaxID=2823807 RepID=A0A939M5N9_9BRAD|nr:ABC transporter permease [Bradyrhizobium barranii]UEM16356.1 ABC transporter permease [Bradyrhizobium barranii subsp. barranii]